MKLFEYNSQYMIPAEGENFKAQLDDMGSLGWELVKIVTEEKTGCLPKYLAIFKRELPAKQEKELLLEENVIK